MDLPWWAWAQAFVMLAPIAAVMLGWHWYQLRKSRALWDRIETANAAFDEWVSQTTTCPACGGQGRVRKYTVHVVDSEAG